MNNDSITATTLYVEMPISGYKNGGIFITTDIFDRFNNILLSPSGDLYKIVSEYERSDDDTHIEVERKEFINYHGFLRFFDGSNNYSACYKHGKFIGIKTGGIEAWIEPGCDYADFINILSLINNSGLSVAEIKSCLSKLPHLDEDDLFEVEEDA